MDYPKCQCRTFYPQNSFPKIKGLTGELAIPEKMVIKTIIGDET
jgi:hypothetical protein